MAVEAERNLDWRDHPGECQAFRSRGFQPCTCPPAQAAERPRWARHDKLCQHYRSQGVARCTCPLSLARCQGNPVGLTVEHYATGERGEVLTGTGAEAHLRLPDGTVTWHPRTDLVIVSDAVTAPGDGAMPQAQKMADKLGFRPVGDGSRLLFDRCCPTPRMGVIHAEYTEPGSPRPVRCELFCQMCGKTLGEFTWQEAGGPPRGGDDDGHRAR